MKTKKTLFKRLKREQRWAKAIWQILTNIRPHVSDNQFKLQCQQYGLTVAQYEALSKIK